MAFGTYQSQEIRTLPCPLCRASESAEYVETGDGRHYFTCPKCTLIFLHPTEHLSARAERERYELHENSRGNPEYVRFLRQLADPVIERLKPGARGLDFGCGPVPVLSELLTSAGFPCVAYDPFFAADDTLLATQYDYVTCSEVVEHAHDPASLFSRLRQLLAPGALLGVMTRFYGDKKTFADWWYRRDPTHVCFYAETTMRWIGERHEWRTDFPEPNVTLFTTTRLPKNDIKPYGSVGAPLPG